MMKRSNSHFSILSLLAWTSAVGFFFGMHAWIARTDSKWIAYLLFNSALPLGFLTCAYQAAHRQPGRSLASSAAATTILWGFAIACVFSRDSQLARLIDPYGQLLDLNFWLLFVLMQTIISILLAIAVAWPYRQLLKLILLRERERRRFVRELLRYRESVSRNAFQKSCHDSNETTWEFIEFDPRTSSRTTYNMLGKRSSGTNSAKHS